MMLFLSRVGLMGNFLNLESTTIEMITFGNDSGLWNWADQRMREPCVIEDGFTRNYVCPLVMDFVMIFAAISAPVSVLVSSLK